MTWLENKNPSDMNGKTINIGDEVVIPNNKGKELLSGQVTKILGPKHHGCGWWEIGIQIQPTQTDYNEKTIKKTNNYYPKSRIVVNFTK